MAWFVWRVGRPDPTRPTAAIHMQDPSRDEADRKGLPQIAAIELLPEHEGMPIKVLQTYTRYALPEHWRATIEGEKTKSIAATKELPS